MCIHVWRSKVKRAHHSLGTSHLELRDQVSLRPLTDQARLAGQQVPHSGIFLIPSQCRGWQVRLSKPGFVVCGFRSRSLPILSLTSTTTNFFKINLLTVNVSNRFIYLVVFDVFKSPSCCSMNQYFISSYGWITCHFMDIPYLFIHLTVDEHLSCSCFWSIMSNATINLCMQTFINTLSFLESKGNPINYSRNYQTIFQ